MTSPTPALPNTCGRCGTRWAGTRTAHCGSCHISFSSPSSFDAHRIRRGTKEGTCADPAAVGLIRQDRAGYAVWAAPGDEVAFERFRGNGAAA